jgi:hypothetical protein
LTERVILTEQDRKLLYRFIATRKLPFTVTLTQGKKRSLDQNRLQRQWLSEIAYQLQDRSAEEVRGECKLTFGVPILREQNEKFREAYDSHLKHLPYETKIAMMMEPLDFPVTRLMTTKQHTEYLDAIHRHYSGLGLTLTDPDPIAHSAEEHA